MVDLIKLILVFLLLSCKPESHQPIQVIRDSQRMRVNELIPRTIIQEFLCEMKSGEEAFLEIKADSSLYLETKSGIFNGHTRRVKDKLSIKIPSMNFAEEIIDYTTLGNILLYFKTKNFLCRAISHKFGPKLDRLIECLNPRTTNNNFAEKSTFTLYHSGRVDRVAWNRNNSSIKSTGVYLIESEKIFMAFPKSKNEDYLNGVLDGDNVWIKQFLGDSGHCLMR